MRSERKTMEHEALLREMIRYEAGVPQRAQHLLKVYEFARLIAVGEKLDAETSRILEVAAIVHDIGIRPALEKYGSGAGPLQEQEGIPAARELLTRLSYEEALIDRVCWLVGHHHTYDAIDGMDYHILVEADFLVNHFEGNTSKEGIQKTLDTIFRTKTGRELCSTMFGL